MIRELSEHIDNIYCKSVRILQKYVDMVLEDTGSSSWCVEYPSLTRMVDEYQRIIDNCCPRGTIWGLVFVERDKELVRRQKQKKHDADKDQLRERVEDADMFLRVEKNVAVQVIKNAVELTEWVCSVTQSMAKSIKLGPYSALDIVGKKADKTPTGTSPQEAAILKMRHSWMCMLATIPGVGETQAKAIVSLFPCPRKLMEVYLDNGKSEEYKKNLLTVACAQKSWQARNPTTDLMRRRSERIYHVMTSMDPTRMIADDDEGNEE